MSIHDKKLLVTYATTIGDDNWFLGDTISTTGTIRNSGNSNNKEYANFTMVWPTEPNMAATDVEAAVATCIKDRIKYTISIGSGYYMLDHSKFNIVDLNVTLMKIDLDTSCDTMLKVYFTFTLTVELSAAIHNKMKLVKKSYACVSAKEIGDEGDA